MKTPIYTLCLIVVSTFLISCSTATDKCTNVNQSRIHQSYTVDYDQTNNKTSVTAQARFGGSSGTTLETDGNCRFAHNQYSLSQDNFLGTTYRGSRNGLDLDHTFTFTNNDNQTYSNSVSLLAIAFSSAPTAVSKASDLSIAWTGGGVRANESVYLYITDGSRTLVESTSVQGATSLTMAATKLVELNSGTGNIYLKRYLSKIDGLNVADVGGYLSAAYQTAKSAITISN